jgi:predicted negative regulator of RcsB-dependent stress response
MSLLSPQMLQYVQRMTEVSAKEELSSTHRWIIGLVAGLILQSGAVFSWAATMQAKVDQNTQDIAAVERRVDDIGQDITAILVGIEQVKGRLGIIEAPDKQ